MKEKLTKDDWKAIQQPLDYKKTGRVNPEFDKHWGHKGNPFWGTDRDPDRKRVEKKTKEITDEILASSMVSIIMVIRKNISDTTLFERIYNQLPQVLRASRSGP